MGIREKFSRSGGSKKRSSEESFVLTRTGAIPSSNHLSRLILSGTDLTDFVNIAVVGCKNSGKSTLINALCGIHIAGGRQLAADGNRYRHPSNADVVFHEMPLNVGVRYVFEIYKLVIILFAASVRDIEMEVAQRAAEMKIPFIFVHPKADVTLDRVQRLEGRKNRDAIQRVKAVVNDRPDMRWFQMKEVDRKIWLVSCSDLAKRGNAKFHEVELLEFIESFYTISTQESTSPLSDLPEIITPVNLDTHSHDLFGSGNELIPSTADSGSFRGRISVPRSIGGTSNSSEHPYIPDLDSDSSRRHPSRSRSKRDNLITASNFSFSSVSGLHGSDGGENNTRVAFVEETAGKTTLLEAFLGMKPRGVKTVAPNVPYRHAEHPTARFYYLDRDSIPPQGFADFFARNLARMDLIVLVYIRKLSESQVQLAVQSKKYGNRVICAHSKSSFKEDSPTAAQKSFSPRAAYRKLRELATKDTKSALIKAGLRQEDFAIFQVSPRILRLPDSYPRSDEEDFKAYIADVCGSPVAASFRSGLLDSPFSTSGHRTPSEPPNHRKIDRFSTLQRSAVLLPSHSRNRSIGALTSTPPSALKPHSPSGSRSTILSINKSTPNSVTWLNPLTVHVAVVGRKKVGKSTLVNGTFNQQVASVNRDHSKQIHRHPGHYDLLFEDFPGYDHNTLMERWIPSMKLGTMDWILIVFRDKLAEADIAIARYADKASIPVAFVATAADAMTEAQMYDEGIVEKAAVERTRCRIIGEFRRQKDEANLKPSPIWIISGRALASSQRRDSKNFYFDEKFYLDFVDRDIAGSLA